MVVEHTDDLDNFNKSPEMVPTVCQIIFFFRQNPWVLVFVIGGVTPLEIKLLQVQIFIS